MTLRELCDYRKYTNAQILAHVEAHLDEINSLDNEGVPLLMNCCMYVYMLLLHYGANVNAQNRINVSTLQRHCAGFSDNDACKRPIIYGANVNNLDYIQYTPLIEAINNGHVKKTSLLISVGVNINNQTKQGETALIRAPVADYNSQLLTIVLLTSGADPNIRDNDDDSFTTCFDRLDTPFQIYLIENGYTDNANESILSIVNHYKTKMAQIVEKMQYQIKPGTEFWKLWHEEFPEKSRFDLLKLL